MAMPIPRIVKVFSRRIFKRKKPNESCSGGLTEPCVARLTKELAAEQNGRLPPEARADLAMTQVRLTRRSVPDEDPEQTLLLWLARRGFHDVLTLRADAGFELSKKKKRQQGLDLCLHVDSERLMRASLNKDPSKPLRHSKDLSNEERASLVQAATCVLEEAKANRMLSYKDLFLLHDHNALAKLARLQRSVGIFWDRGDVLLDAMAAYFGSRVGFYFAWLKFYTAALVYPTVVGLLVWWTEGVGEQAFETNVGGRGGDFVKLDETRNGNAATEQTCAPDCNCEGGVSNDPWWEWSVKATEAAAASAAVEWSKWNTYTWKTWNSWNRQRSESAPTSLTPYLNMFLALWSTLFLVMWKRRSNTLAFRWGVHKEDTFARAKFMVGWKRRDRMGGSLRQTADRSRHSSFFTDSDHGPQRLGDENSHAVVADKVVLRRRCATGRLRATAMEAATAVIESTAGEAPGVVGRTSRLDGLEASTWEPLRTTRLFVSWVLEAAILYLAVRMMLWFAWLEVQSLQQFGGGVNVHVVRIASVIIPTTFYGIHAKWAQAMTNWEGHVTEALAENSMTVKLFTFRSVNSFSRLFYLGFWQRDLVGLHQMLVTALITRSSVDALHEIVAPTVQQYLSRWRLGGAAAFSTIAAAGGGDVSAMPPPSSGRLPAQRQRQHHRTHSRLVANVDEHPEVAYRALEQAALSRSKKHKWREAFMNERKLPEFETQGEYLDLMVQYGYVTMFAVVYPLAPLLALVRCLAEIYIGHKKLLRCRRPPYVERSGIGAWYGILDFIGMASVLTNCILLGLTAKTRRLHIPIPLANQFPHSKYLVMAVFVEHMILGVKAAVRVLIDDVPDGVERAVAEELLHDHDQTRREVEGILGFGEDVAATHVTIVRQQQQTPSEEPLPHSYNPSSSSSPLTTPLEMNDHSQHSNGSVLSVSSVHMLSSSSRLRGGGPSRPKRRPWKNRPLSPLLSRNMSAPFLSPDDPLPMPPPPPTRSFSSPPRGENRGNGRLSSLTVDQSGSDSDEDYPGMSGSESRGFVRRGDLRESASGVEAAAMRSVFSAPKGRSRRKIKFGLRNA